MEPAETQLPATITQAEITTSSDPHTTLIVPALIADLGDHAAGAMSNSSPPISATRTRAEPMRGRAPVFGLVRRARPDARRDPAV